MVSLFDHRSECLDPALRWDPTATPQRSTPVNAASAIPQRRLTFVDGLRGLLALLIVLHHVGDFVAAPAFLEALTQGRYRLALFMLLSGFVLYLPSAGAATVRMPRPLLDLAHRRARRLLPAWYASLLLCVSVGVLFAYAGYSPPFPFLPCDWQDVVTHLTMTHSVTGYAGSINGPGYTLGTEWQMSLLMAVFLPLAARAGWLPLIGLVSALAVVTLPHPFGPVVYKLFPPEFTLPFVLGLAAARLARFPAERLRVPPSTLVPVLAAVFVSGVAANAILFLRYPNNFALLAASASVAGGAFCVLMAWHPGNALNRLLSHRVLQALGRISYSIYLTHFPLLALCGFAASRLGLSGQPAFYRVFLPALPLLVAFAWAFYQAFERPFLRRRPEGTASVAPACLAPAPR